MSEEKRYYVAANSDIIIEYPSKTVYTPVCTASDGGNVIVLPEDDIAYYDTVFRLHPAIAEAAIEVWKARSIDATEFVKRYCQRSGITIEELQKAGGTAVPCNCGELYCEGWRIECIT